MPKPLNIALIGTGFMGRAHSNAWMSVNKFFDLPRDAVMHTVCARESKDARRFARKWGVRTLCGPWMAVVDLPIPDIQKHHPAHWRAA